MTDLIYPLIREAFTGPYSTVLYLLCGFLLYSGADSFAEASRGWFSEDKEDGGDAEG